MTQTRIYGASDDLIEIDGAISDELGAYNEDVMGIAASDGTLAEIEYGKGGEWKIRVKAKGSAFVSCVDSVGEDAEHDGIAKGCTSYSDVLILDGAAWVVIGRTFAYMQGCADTRDKLRSFPPAEAMAGLLDLIRWEGSDALDSRGPISVIHTIADEWRALKSTLPLKAGESNDSAIADAAREHYANCPGDFTGRLEELLSGGA